MTTPPTTPATTPTGLRAYRDVLAVPGVTGLTVAGFAARLPETAAGVLLTLHVAIGLGAGFAAAGLVGAAITVGMALGAPLLGRLVDRGGLRPVLVLAGTAEGLFWAGAPLLGLPALLPAAFVAGVLAVPAFSVIRQALTVAVPEHRRRPAFALDAMSAELTYIVGPATGTALALALPPAVGMRLVGAGFVIAAAALWWLDPPTRDPAEAAGPVRGTGGARWRPGRPMLLALAGTSAAILVLVATELGVVAALTARGETGFFAVTNTVWCAASLVGGFVHGAARRPRPFPVLLGALGLASLPVALGGPWWVTALLLVPAGFFCAPALATAAETVGRLAPPAARGVATGLHASAITLGAAVAAPVSGLLIDRVAPAAPVLVAGAVTLAVAGAAGALGRAHQATAPPSTSRFTPVQ